MLTSTVRQTFDSSISLYTGFPRIHHSYHRRRQSRLPRVTIISPHESRLNAGVGCQIHPQTAKRVQWISPYFVLVPPDYENLFFHEARAE